ncbi:MAG: FAD-dependent oxidoreductase, partial [Salinibacter sp.]
MPTVGVIGAGIAGLAAGYTLQQNGVSVRILEASDRTGGVIRSESTEGYLVEHGPNSIRAGAAPLERIIRDLDLQEERVWANDAANTRYVVRDGHPVALPASPGSLLTTD